jgi:ligand-binding SRPBCC domain-containing protein
VTVYTSERTQKLPVHAAPLFPFFQMPEHLAQITPPSMGFHILTPSPIQMRTGALSDYTVRVFGIGVRWTTMITVYDPPYKFVDEQSKGPYWFWHYAHAFVGQGGGTLMVDTVRYALPFGAFGRLAHAIFARPRIERNSEYGAQVVARVFEVAGTGVVQVLPQKKSQESIAGAFE